MIMDILEELAEPTNEYDGVYRGYIYKSKMQMEPEKAYIINVVTNVKAQITPAMKRKLMSGETWFYVSRWYYNPWLLQVVLSKQLTNVNIPDYLRDAIQMEISTNNITNHVDFNAPFTTAIRYFILKNVEVDIGLRRMLTVPTAWESASLLRSNPLDEDDKDALVNYFKFRRV